MINSKIRKFLFKCDACQMILSIEFEDEEDLKDVQDNKIELECVCSGKAKVLRD